jgi:hypothetical protein
VLVLGLLVLAVIEGIVGWELPGIGKSLFWPEVAVVAIGMLLSFLTATVLVLRQRKVLGMRFLVCGGLVTALGLLWTMDAVLPLRVLSVESQLTQLQRCAVGQGTSGSCPRRATWTAPLLGPTLQPSNYWGVPGEIAFPQGPSAFSGGILTGGYFNGYFYEANTSLAMSGPNCVRHLYGPWYEFGMFTGSCPWGYSYKFEGASPGPPFSRARRLQRAWRG